MYIYVYAHTYPYCGWRKAGTDNPHFLGYQVHLVMQDSQKDRNFEKSQLTSRSESRGPLGTPLLKRGLHRASGGVLKESLGTDFDNLPIIMQSGL